MTNTTPCPHCNSINTKTNVSPPFMKCLDCDRSFRGPEVCHLCHQPVEGPWNASHGIGRCKAPTPAEARELVSSRAPTHEEAEDMGDYSHLNG